MDTKDRDVQTHAGKRAWEGGGGDCSNAVPAKECLGSQELKEGRMDPPLEPSEGAQPCPHPDFRVLASRTGRGGISAIEAGWFIMAAPGNTQTPGLNHPRSHRSLSGTPHRQQVLSEYWPFPLLPLRAVGKNYPLEDHCPINIPSLLSPGPLDPLPCLPGDHPIHTFSVLLLPDFLQVTSPPVPLSAACTPHFFSPAGVLGLSSPLSVTVPSPVSTPSLSLSLAFKCWVPFHCKH